MLRESAPHNRALRRLRQLASEERAAIGANDVDGLCRIAELLPSAMQRLADTPLDDTPENRAVLSELEAANAAAEVYLTAQMQAVSDRLKVCASARRAARVYSRRVGTGATLLDDQS